MLSVMLFLSAQTLKFSEPSAVVTVISQASISGHTDSPHEHSGGHCGKEISFEGVS